MSAAFKVGEIAILCNCEFHPEYEGEEVEVIGGLKIRPTRQNPNCKLLRYAVRAADGRLFAPTPPKLRKKQPPRSAKAIMREAILKAKHPCEVTA